MMRPFYWIKIMTYPAETKEVTLEYPIHVAGKEYKTLTMRRPKVRDQL
ncbi:phage tail assembly protein, partial [Vibrio sp. 10N.222.55.E8]